MLVLLQPEGWEVVEVTHVVEGEVITEYVEVVRTVEVTRIPTSPSGDSGRLEVTYASEMVVDKPEILTVEIVANPALAELGAYPEYATGVISIEVNSHTGARGKIEKRIRLYPIMSAEVILGDNFEVTASNGSARRSIALTNSASWVWSITPKKPGEHRVTISIYGETTVANERFPILVKSDTYFVRVSDRPFLAKLYDTLANNFVAVVGTGGPLGLIITYLSSANRSFRNSEMLPLGNSQKKETMYWHMTPIQ